MAEEPLSREEFIAKIFSFVFRMQKVIKEWDCDPWRTIRIAARMEDKEKAPCHSENADKVQSK